MYVAMTYRCGWHEYKRLGRRKLARLVQRVNRNFDERRLTSAVFLDVAKAFDTVWVNSFTS
jgi:hypothetical protein